MISIIVPVYRSESTLRRCVESLTAQTYVEIEIILVIDGSPDGSGELAEELAAEDARIRVIYQENQGVSVARNTGIEAARGDYVLFVDSDDYVAETLCEKMWLAIAEYNADLAVCGFHHLYFGRDVVKVPEESLCIVRKEKEKILSLYEKQFLNMPWNKLFRREMITGRFRTDMDLGEDLLFNMSYLEGCKQIVTLAEPLVFYIQDDRGTTLSTKRRENRMENAFYLYEQMREYCERFYGERQTGGILESRLVEEFLDEMEGLAFASDLKFGEKRSVIRSYYTGYCRLENKNDIFVNLLDYKIIRFFFEKKCFFLTLCMVELRGLVVKAVWSWRRK
ncbi:MAG: glycosyltransferase family 2 protein [Clostridiales bacterium]|nr:glycosyltransferase family 2 protein [Clostridiales bacterium]